jgi:radical SAM protein with 4Fe4S-binding SPASM domain
VAYMTMGEPSEEIKRYLKLKGIGVEYPQMLSRGGNLENVAARYKEGPIRCAANRWHQNVVLPDGDVQACCMSYNLSLPCGNLLAESYATIHQRATNYSANSNPPKDSICRRCEWSAPI